MSTFRMIFRVMGAAAVAATAATAACADMLFAEVRQEVQREQTPGVWPENEPAGMTPIFLVDGSTKGWPGFRHGGAWADDDRVAVVDDADSKHGQAIEKRFFVGDESGWHGITHRSDFGGFRELYQRIVFKLSPNWQWHSGGTKFFYWGGNGRPARTSPTQFFINATGRGVVQFIDQSTSGEADSKGTFRSVNAPRIQRDRYHTIEVLHVANTPGNSDGSLRMWIDGIEVRSFNHLGRRDRRNVELDNVRWLDYQDPTLGGLEAFLFWGGQRDTKKVNDWIRLSEFYISGKR